MGNKIMPHHLQQPLPKPPPKSNPQTEKSHTSFKAVFDQQLQNETSLKLSKHAEKRLQERNIELGDKKWQQIEEKVAEAKQKGVNDSLVITEQAALVVSAKNDTVITAMNRQEAKDQLFTNINGTIVVD
ncbi:TIGR02530 family flagellar biosynthesis protein [Texcoconibacillus texcoconensis]|uniref:Flagellar operon protein n=1 Tax=Texcoconibacillus texcoconensis TaxID=1095777 RepID=A0A840QL28_9BACI|nr:TIGR02530 family flagellar biosynthesis protein [Texcoconibacillus texcoconensis]MBB5172072.1 flagellar operon protein [Texcoconibacillus texcoconensis]